MKIYPSLPSGNLLNLEQTIKTLDAHVDGFHLDIMDFHFVPNLTFGPAFVNQLRNATDKELWIHLMVEKPLELIRQLKLKSSDRISMHLETLNKPHLIEDAKKLYPHIGLAINPDTHLGEIIPLLPRIDHVLLMSVHPGFSGQKFLESTWIRLKELYELKQKHPHLIIKIDGGINESNIPTIATLADAAAVSTAIFHNQNLIENLQKLQQSIG